MAHEDPLRLRVLKALTALLENIAEDSNSTLVSYRHNLRGSVFRGRVQFGENDPLPLVSILEFPVPEDALPPPRESGLASNTYDLMIQGFVKDLKVSATDLTIHETDPAYYLSADVTKALATEIRRIAEVRHTRGFSRREALLGVYDSKGNPAIDNIIIGQPVHRPSDEMSAVAYFWMRVSIILTEDLADPYG